MGVLASSDPACAVPPCGTYSRAPLGNQAPTEFPGIRRRALQKLLIGKTEISPSGEGHRRFREVAADGSETVISVHPVNELIQRQEIRNTRMRIVADLQWTRVREKFVRERMDVVSEEVVGGRSLVSRTTIRLSDVQWNLPAGR